MITRKKKQKKKQFSNIKTLHTENATLDINEEEFSSIECHHQERANLLRSSYWSLTDIQQYCLLSFSTFPCSEDEVDMNTKSLMIKKKILIFLWDGEGILEEKAGHVDMANQVSHDIEEAGKQILKVLTEKGFIEPMIKKHRETASCRMLHFVHSFVTPMAKEADFFYFHKQNSKLTPYYFTRFRRDCSLQFQVGSVSSSKLQPRMSDGVESLSHVLTLFNSNESDVELKREWFSEMKHLRVLYLGSWRSGNAKLIEVVDEKLFKYLKAMKQLRLLSLQRMSAVKKLPDSI